MALPQKSDIHLPRKCLKKTHPYAIMRPRNHPKVPRTSLRRIRTRLGEPYLADKRHRVRKKWFYKNEPYAGGSGYTSETRDKAQKTKVSFSGAWPWSGRAAPC